MRAVSSKYKGLRVTVGKGSVKFEGGVAEVSEAQAKALRKLPESFGVTVEDAPKVEPKKSADPEKDSSDGKGKPEKADDGAKQPDGAGTVLERPAGNASLEAWQAYGVQEGHDVTDLKQSDIRALFTE